ncbi:uncharacterized protein EV154DRAFT_487174 [Mucor mucedo]|uniref:uncharacterized protein n=1 Tax=Mucor mucedo TaxID=29922 RepID=UPI00221EBABC|nr:uncharacterized protein EV154DRAFT_487174 [Mucor mucedo]KAI7873484.1 hypothetical protein EV154DRAFT_487174 [Mucor mucedo]
MLKIKEFTTGLYYTGNMRVPLEYYNLTTLKVILYDIYWRKYDSINYKINPKFSLYHKWYWHGLTFVSSNMAIFLLGHHPLLGSVKYIITKTSLQSNDTIRAALDETQMW